MNKRALLLSLFVFIASLLIAQEQADTTNIESSGEVFLQAASLPAARLGYTHRFVIPFLQGQNPLTQDNNVSIALTADVSPVSINGTVEAVWTPIAFFYTVFGGRIGSGWNLKLLGSDVYGIGLNRADAQDNAEHNGSAFDGLLYKANAGAALQADLAAVIPGDWNHVLFRSYHEINYQAYSRAAKNESWYYENDEGENCNGFNYYGNLLLGYQMPVFFNLLAGLLAEADFHFYDMPDRGTWGGDKIRWWLSVLTNLTLTPQLDLILAVQFRTERNYLESNWKDLYYRNRTLNTSNPLRLEFYRAAAIVTYKLGSRE